MVTKRLKVTRDYLFLVLAVVVASGCSKSVTIEIENPSQKRYDNEVVAVNAHDVAQKLGQESWVVVNKHGKVMPSQITSDSLLLFIGNVPANGKTYYKVIPGEESYDTITKGRIFHERLDDLGWENDLVGFRAYGPPLQATGEKGYGYDIFTKRATKEPILNKLYEMEKEPGWWDKYNEFKEAGENLRADSMIKTHSYHVDHGYGMDCFQAGPTLGAGCTALVIDDNIKYPWCWDQQRILDNGPLRFRAILAYEPQTVGNQKYTEIRDITLDAGKRLNHTKVQYKGLIEPETLVAGFPLRDDGAVNIDDSNNYFAYVNPTLHLFPNLREDQGKIFQGIVLTHSADSIASREDEGIFHLVAYNKYRPGNDFEYYWGFSWDKAGITWQQWNDYLAAEADALAHPLIITIK